MSLTAEKDKLMVLIYICCSFSAAAFVSGCIKSSIRLTKEVHLLSNQQATFSPGLYDL
jgi:hypothetical protein